MRELLLLQLAFNILILLTLLFLAWSGSKPRRRKSARPERAASKAKKARAPREAAPAAPREVPAGLDSLIEQAEARELVAEQALRERLSEFKAQDARG